MDSSTKSCLKLVIIFIASCFKLTLIALKFNSYDASIEQIEDHSKQTIDAINKL